MPAQSVCKGCGQPISGNYLTAMDACWHPEHFVCAACGRSIREEHFQQHQGRPYHIECYDQTIAPRCAHCGQPIREERFRQYQGRPYHIECYNQAIAPRCAYCGRPLVGEYLIDHWGTRFCKEHQHQFPLCSYCGRLVPPQEQEAGRSHEEMRCAVCRSTAIELAEEARPIFKKLIQWVGSQGLRYNNLPLTLELCGREKLAHYLSERGPSHSLGATMGKTYLLDGQVVRSEVMGVAVLLGLPATLFQDVTIHELGHVWLIVQGIQDLPSWAEEGFCELLSYRYSSGLNTPEGRYHAASIERNSDPIYGEGFRRIRARADAIGFQRFVEALQSTKRLP